MEGDSENPPNKNYIACDRKDMTSEFAHWAGIGRWGWGGDGVGDGGGGLLNS